MSTKSDELMKKEPAVLTIAGSDSSGGAGIQADLKTFAALHTYGASAITCITAQNPSGVQGIQAIDTILVAQQIKAVCEACPIAAAKTGMLYSAAIIRTVAAEIIAQGLPLLVVDPVMVAQSGARLLQADAVDALYRELLPLARVITPNLHECEILCGRSITNTDELRQAARDICEKYDVACIAKGGHLPEADTIVDVLFDEGEEFLFKSKYIPDAHTHGAGCAFSAALTALLAKGIILAEAVQRAKHYVNRAIAHAVPVGHHRPLRFCWPTEHAAEAHG